MMVTQNHMRRRGKLIQHTKSPFFAVRVRTGHISVSEHFGMPEIEIDLGCVYDE